ncbi:FAST kinase domain-containing protein 5, mitochondrial-like [Littorina saxatilis]|uniref:RAP domain-containing protein n=1 Tax=Littorina saxatilis TaxID=31220 RepID=A0AAN9GPG2_9CAEN
MLRSFQLICKAPSLVCPRCQRFTFPHKFIGLIIPNSHYSAAKLPAKKSHAADFQLRQGFERRQLKSYDPIRPVSDILLQSLNRRHADSFAVPAGNPSFSLATPLAEVSTTDLVCAIYTPPTDEVAKTAHLKDIEQLLVKRLYRMSLALMLQACHGFYIQGFTFRQFLSQMFGVIDEMFDELTPSPGEVSQLFLYIFIHGNAPAMLFHKVEEYLLTNLDKFHVNDLGVICVGFFRGNSRLSSQDLLDAIAKKLLRDLESLEPFLLLDFVKMFRHASYIKASFYEQLGDQLVQSKFLSNYNTINPIMHIAFTFASIPVNHTQLFEGLFSRAEKILTQQRNIRTKDISKFVWACGTLQFQPEGWETRYKQLMECFEARHNSRNFPESLAELLMGLVYLAVFPERLLQECLSPEIANRLLQSGSDKEKSIQLLLLNETVKMECPDYKGCLLSEDHLTVLMQHPSVSRDLETELQTRTGLLAVLTSLEHCLGSEKVHCCYPLLHFKTAVIELQHCTEHGFISFTSPAARQLAQSAWLRREFTQRAITDQLYSALTKPQPANVALEQPVNNPVPSFVTRLAILVSSNSQYALNDNTHMLGHLRTMKRQLGKAGYTVLQISPTDALQLELASHEERCRFLSQRLSSALQADIMLS